ncbi:HAD family phosphatase [Candidatus Villigracilis affinis]|uniref:HAD family hydrolase n=1 Tax=Candidatus Villigracilis affinis TaxID=3140682 RepID=UPI002A238541|nr:HAD family phosphatase [Anaerolineales bacterium]
MPVRAVFFDFGGVIMRTEYQSPRQHLAERFGMDYDDIDKVVFASESARRASVGAIPEHAHWAEVLKRLKHPISEMKSFQDEFFGGDVIDRDLVEYIRSLRGKVHTGLISNAWSGLREFIAREKVIDVFDTVTISAEVGAIKPEAKIYQVALEQARVKAEEAVFVDDVNINLEGCEDLGMTGILFKNPQDSIAELKRLLEEHT